MTMKKGTLAESIRQELKFNKTRSAELVESVLEIIRETLEQGEDVLISGFGKFYINDKRERLGWNPHMAEAMMISARRVVKFKSTKKLQKAINGGDIFP